MTLSERIRATGPKRILALDGGGIRGIITLEILARIESLLREKSGRRDDFVLTDYFTLLRVPVPGRLSAPPSPWVCR